MRKFLLKRLLPFLASVVVLDVDLVMRSEGIYARARIEVYDFNVLDRMIKLPEEIGKILWEHRDFFNERLTNN